MTGYGTVMLWAEELHLDNLDDLLLMGGGVTS